MKLDPVKVKKSMITPEQIPYMIISLVIAVVLYVLEEIFGLVGLIV